MQKKTAVRRHEGVEEARGRRLKSRGELKCAARTRFTRRTGRETLLIRKGE